MILHDDNKHQRNKWVTVWGNAPSITEYRPEQYARNLTLSYPMIMPFGGSGIKVRFSNRYGDEAIRIEKSSILLLRNRKLSDCIVYPYHEASLLREETEEISLLDMPVTIAPGEEYMSEPVRAEVSQGEMIVVQFYLKDFTSMRSGVFTSGIYSGGYFTEGDYTGNAYLPGNQTISTNINYMLTDVLLQTEEHHHSIICYGDSITAQDWPEYCLKNFLQDKDNNTAIIRKAASGTRIMRQYECNQYKSYGIRGEIRFPHECVVEGADTILIQHGINDIIHPVGTEVNPYRPWSDLPKAEEMIEGYRGYIRIAREHGLKVYMGTLLPIKGWRTYIDLRDELRCGVNEWIRTNDEIDGVVDFDLAVRSETEPLTFAEGFDSGDHLHPSKRAYQCMGGCAYRILKNR